jgi:lupus La protein
MSGLPVETVEPDAAATSIPIEKSVQTEGGDASAPTDTAAEVVANGANGSTEAKVELMDDNKEKAPKENGKKEPRKRTYEDGVLKTSAQETEGENNSKYDPSVLPVTDDAKQIRSQVRIA